MTEVGNDATLHINMYPAIVDCEASVKVYFTTTDEEKHRAMTEAPQHMLQYRVYFYGGTTYMWEIGTGPIPSEVRTWPALTHVGDLPAAVMQKALLDAAARRLHDDGFESIPTRPPSPMLFFRRQTNLVKRAFAELDDDDAGLFPVVRVQSTVLDGDWVSPGAVALILDSQTVNELRLPLSTLIDASCDLVNSGFNWDHQPNCTCPNDESTSGFAGRLVRHQLPDSVVLREGGLEKTIPVTCVSPIITRPVLEQYIANLLSKQLPAVHSLLDRQLSRYRDPLQQWKRLATFGQHLEPLEMFPGVRASLGSAIEVDGEVGGPWLAVPQAQPQIAFKFGKNVFAASSGAGLTRHGPYDEHIERVDPIKIVILAPSTMAQSARRLLKVLTEGVGHVKGFKQRFRLQSCIVSLALFQGQDADAHRRAAVDAATSGAQLVFLLTRARDRYLPIGQDPYRVVRVVLLGSGIAVQAVQEERLTVPDSQLRWTAANFTSTAYAKVGNVPYVLHDPGGTSEIVVGIGRTDVHDGISGKPQQILGVAAAFRQDGDFLFAGSTVPVFNFDQYETRLEALLRDVVSQYEEEQGIQLKRLTVHAFKKTGRRELNATRAALGGRDIEFALVHVNRDSPLWLAGQPGSGEIVLPSAGTTVGLGALDRLLVTGAAGPLDRHPLRLTVDRGSTFQDMHRILEQIYGFTMVSWRSLNQSREPASILYGRLLAQKVGELMPYGLHPDVVSGALSRRPWFL
jgi:hypothetical protein